MDILIFLSEFMVPLTVFYIVGSGILAKRPVFDDFLDGAKEGMRTVADVLPTLIGLMTAVGVLRASGILEVLSELLKFPAALCHIPVPVIPIILVRIISSSAAVGLILDIFKEYGPDSLVGNMVSIMSRFSSGSNHDHDRIFICETGVMVPPVVVVSFALDGVLAESAAPF